MSLLSLIFLYYYYRIILDLCENRDRISLGGIPPPRCSEVAASPSELPFSLLSVPICCTRFPNCARFRGFLYVPLE